MIVVTGGAGFIGSNLVWELNRRGRTDILVVDRLEPEKHKNLNALDIDDFIDLDDFLDIFDDLGPIDAIFHQGACSDTTATDGEYIYRNNLAYSQSLAALAASQSIPFIYASSASVYGHGTNGFREERSCEDPLNLYASSKFLFDNWVRRQSFENKVVGLRYFNVYGPQENHKGRMASTVRHFFTQIEEQGRLKIFDGSDTFRRDFVHVDDVVSVNLHFWENGGSGIFNVGTGQARPFTDIAEGVIKTLGKGEIETIPFPKDLEGKYQTYTCADLAALRAAGFTKEMYSLDEGVARYVDTLQTSGGMRRVVD